MEEMKETETMMAKDHEEFRVCVIDASTYVGFWILKKLLIKGYRVHAAVQNNGMFSFFLSLFLRKHIHTHTRHTI